MKFSIKKILHFIITLALPELGKTICIYIARTKQGNTFNKQKFNPLQRVYMLTGNLLGYRPVELINTHHHH